MISFTRSHVLRALCITLVLVSVQPAMDAAASASGAGGGTPNGCPRVDSAALERFFDAHFQRGLAEGLFPGAAVAFVQDGRLVLAKGYGLANIATATPVDPERTPFFAGSISKLVTATAVVQLADRGLVDLDTDINRYLANVHVDSTFDQPITLRHLLTHTGGMDRRDIGMAAHSPSHVLSLEEYLERDQTPRIDPPGTAFRYSNLGIALAGLVVQDVSGQPFATYVRENIFAPLGMLHSTFDIPRDDSELTPGYIPLAGRESWRSGRPVYSHNAPAIGLRTTAQDMALFLLANLNGGALDGHRVLSDSAIAMMHRLPFSADPRLDGTGLGFRIGRRLGVRIIGHRGLINQHASILDLVPEANAGFFVACNAGDCARMEPVIDSLFLGYLCGRPPEPVNGPLVRSIVPASRLAGTYRPRRHARLTVEKARGMFDELELSARGDTLVVTPNSGPREPRLLVPIAEDEYELVTGGARMVLVPSPSGDYRLFFSGAGFPQEEIIRLSYVETRSFFMRMMLASAAGLASAIVLLPVVLIARRRRGSPGARGVGLAAAVGGTLLCATLLVFIHGLQTVLASAVETEFIFGVPESVRALLWLPVAAIVVGFPLPALAVALWRRRLWTVAERVYYAALLLGSAALLLVLHYWNFIGSRF